MIKKNLHKNAITFHSNDAQTNDDTTDAIQFFIWMEIS